jgi:hypothetical protein
MKQMSDKIPEMQWEEEVELVPEDSQDVQEDPDEDLPDEAKKLSKKDLYDKLQAKMKEPPQVVDNSAAVVDGIAKLVERIGPQGPAPQQGENDEVFAKRLKDQLFDDNTMYPTLKEAILRVASPLIAQQGDTVYSQAQKIMELDPETGPIYKKYKGEIENYIQKTFPANVRKNPQALDIAYKQVYAQHVNEIAEEIAKKKVAEEMEKLKGVSQAEEKTRRNSFSLEGSSSVSGVSQQKKRVGFTKEDARIADERGVDLQHVVERKQR